MTDIEPFSVSPLRTLVIDDDPIFLEMATSCLGQAGHEVTAARDGGGGLEHLRGEPFDLALVDLTMPKLDGFRLIAILRASSRFADMTIVVISVRQDAEAIAEAIALGANDYITKPVNWALLPARLKRTLAQRGQPHVRPRFGGTMLPWRRQLGT